MTWLCLVLAGCPPMKSVLKDGGPTPDAASDAGSDAPSDAATDAAIDAGTDAPTDAAADAPEDASVDAEPPDGDVDLVLWGEDVFQRTAGGVGCQHCHGTDALGDIGPCIRGRSLATIENALNTVKEMEFLNLTDQEIEAVYTYLQTLGPCTDGM